MLSIPFAVTNPLVENIEDSKEQWLGALDTTFTGVWIDLFIAMVCNTFVPFDQYTHVLVYSGFYFQTLGTIPWQAYFQRVLSVKSAAHAQLLSVAGAFGALILAVPSLIIGAVSVSTGKQYFPHKFHTRYLFLSFT